MKKIDFSVQIDAPRLLVFETMVSAPTYEIWTAAFMEGSRYEGSWEQGKKIRFLGPEPSGMVAEIAANRKGEFISIRHLGSIKDGVEDTESEEVRKWAPCYEDYSFRDKDGGTEVGIRMDVNPAWEEFMLKAWPLALKKLKELCESKFAQG